MRQPKVILIVLDGWGYSLTKDGNAILNAKKPTFDYLWDNFPHILMSASGEEVGLPWGELGGSEVGHLTIGSGRILYQNLPRITQAINDKTFYKNEYLNKAIANAEIKKTNLHLIGLVSSGGVHSHISHIEAILHLIKTKHFTGKTFIHMITDGRDTPQKSAGMFLEKIQDIINELKLDAHFSTLIGRYYAMDRDHHWDRTRVAYSAIVEAKGYQANSAQEAIKQAYDRSETDEFIKPTIILNKFRKKSLFTNLLNKDKGETAEFTPVKENDSVIFFNFRPDRMRQLVELFLFPRSDMPDKLTLKKLHPVSMTNYNESMPIDVAFPLQHVKSTVAKIISENHMTQLHIAETEKYAHVTYFFNGGYPQINPGEKWQLIPSPPVPTFDKKPEMSAQQITDYVIEQNKATPFDFILINFANADMVGHTGNYKATVKAIEAIDRQLGCLTKTFPDSYLLIGADHGNAEEMIDSQTGETNTGHSINPVPFIIAHPSLKLSKPQPKTTDPAAMIADIAPTVLALLGLKPSAEMTGINLLENMGPQISQKINHQITDKG
ncbi:MAG: 2,3-bisphosphoglycerate-independent phosphoglycerate mutase [bacterium]|nr:2,3-bisphosphoglycerate-independent phosphoglycerate mutase [bacterium]